jgi:hypothetical protein
MAYYLQGAEPDSVCSDGTRYQPLTILLTKKTARICKPRKQMKALSRAFLNNLAIGLGR